MRRSAPASATNTIGPTGVVPATLTMRSAGPSADSCTLASLARAPLITTCTSTGWPARSALGTLERNVQPAGVGLGAGA